MNTDWPIRIGLATVAGLTYFAGAIPSNMHLGDIGNLPLQTWAYFTINILTGIFSPSLVRGAASVAAKAVKK